MAIEAKAKAKAREEKPKLKVGGVLKDVKRI